MIIIKIIAMFLLALFSGLFGYFILSAVMLHKKKNKSLLVYIYILLSFIGNIFCFILYWKIEQTFIIELNEVEQLLTGVPGIIFVLGSTLRVVKYIFFEKGKKKNFCPKCGSIVNISEDIVCWRCKLNLEEYWNNHKNHFKGKKIG